jgi:hypothetical protein
MIKKLIIFTVFFVGCNQHQKPIEPTKKYTVVSMFNEVVLTTDDEAHAYKVANEMTLLGRILASKPSYFVRVNDEKGH